LLLFGFLAMSNNQYPVTPEQQGDEDYKLNPYSPV
jgi:hypothetical protein